MTLRCSFGICIAACDTASGRPGTSDLARPFAAIVTARAPLPLSIWARTPASVLPFPLNDERCRLFTRARHGLYLGLRAAGVRNGDEALAPAFHHGSEIEALIRSGLNLVFYEATETLVPDEHELERLLTPRTRVLHLIHYIGFPQDASRWRRWCDERGLLLVEDAAQSWLAAHEGRPIGSDGDLVLFCLYKAFGVPDGGAVLSRAGWPAVAAAPRRLGLVGLAFVHGLSLLPRSRALSLVADVLHRERAYDIEAQIALGDPASDASVATRLALPRVVDIAAAEKRRSHYERLLRQLAHLVPIAFREVPSGASPFFFPVETAEKTQLMRRLRARGVRAYDLWPAPHPALPIRAFPRANALRASIVGLPVHQELTEEEVERVASAALESTR